jgi:AcrR family transcriptional regulator
MARIKTPGLESVILHAAIECFGKEGFTKTTISTIAKRAGISHATVFLYFANKEDLFHNAVIKPQQWHVEEQIKMINNAAGNPAEKLRKIVHQQVDYFLGQKNYLRLVQYVFGQKERFNDLVNQIYKYSADYIEHLEAIVKQGQIEGFLPKGNANLICWSYFAFLNGISLTFNENMHDELIEQLAISSLRIFGIN